MYLLALVSNNLELPHLILGKNTKLGALQIMVYRMEDTVPCLVKSINLHFNGSTLSPRRLVVENQFCLGLVVYDEQGGTSVHQFVKKELIAAEPNPDQTEKREIRVCEDLGVPLIHMNSTCYVATVGRQNSDIWKTDIWMSNNIL